MDQIALDRYRQQLEKMRRRLREDQSTLMEQTQMGSLGQKGGDLSNNPFHLADMGTEEYLADLNATLLENEALAAAEIQSALERLNNGTYGSCERCHQPIAPERLEALPFVRLCIDCARQTPSMPRVNLNVGRPATPRDTLAPEGEMEEDQTIAAGRTVPAQDIHAAGTAGGGTEFGGLAGSNVGDGAPVIGRVQRATASGTDAAEEDE
jgi:RNA polymerase-binding transcription factor DksA